MLKIAICDDEHLFAVRLKRTISEYLDERKVPYEISIFHSGKEFTELGSEMITYHAVFLDINMENMDGLETAGQIRRYSDDTFLVFVTAYINYSLEGYKYHAIRYILKDNTMFEDSIRECIETILDKRNVSTQKKIIQFHEGKKEFSLSNLIYIESKLHKLEFHVMSERECIYTLYDTLNHIEEAYLPYHFVRIHQSYLVNELHIVELKRYEARLSTGAVLPVPKARYHTVLDAFIAYQGEL